MFSQLVQQIMPNFVTQRSLYEVRERPAKTYSWKVFILSNIVVEIPWSRESEYEVKVDIQFSPEYSFSSAGTTLSVTTVTRSRPTRFMSEERSCSYTS